MEDIVAYAAPDAWRLLERPLRLRHIGLFESLLAEIARVQARTPGQIVDKLLRNSSLLALSFANVEHDQDYSDELNAILTHFVDTFLRHADLDLTLKHQLEPSCFVLLLLCSLDSLDDQRLGQIVVRCAPQLRVRGEQQRRLVFDELVGRKRFSVIRQWFASCPEAQLARTMFTECQSHNYALCQDIEMMLQTTFCYSGETDDEDNIARVEFLIDVFADLWCERALMRLVRMCAGVAAATGLLRQLLAMPRCPDVAAGWSKVGDARRWPSDARSPLFTALMCRCADNFEVLFGAVREKRAILAMEEYNGDSILAAAVWSRNSVRTLFASANDENYLIEEDSDSLDAGKNQGEYDEDNQKELNKYDAAKRTTFSLIMQLLLAVGCDPLAVNRSQQTLLHFAVFNDNLAALRLFLQLGVDPMRADRRGYLPVHAVRSLTMFEELLRSCCPTGGISVSDLMSRRSANGETPLAAVCIRAAYDDIKGASRNGVAERMDADAVALLDAMLAASGPNCLLHDRDDQGSTIMHRVHRNPRLTRWLLSNGADVGARNRAGETPLDAQMKYGDMDVVVMMRGAQEGDVDLYKI